MRTCAYQFADGDDSVPVANMDTGAADVGLADDLPVPAAAGRQNFRNLLPSDTLLQLGNEAASGNGARIFSSRRSSRAGNGALWLIALAGTLYLATR